MSKDNTEKVYSSTFVKPGWICCTTPSIRGLQLDCTRLHFESASCRSSCGSCPYDVIREWDAADVLSRVTSQMSSDPYAWGPSSLIRLGAHRQSG
ncbi:hypothetical protein EVAR_2515_1 [Eumeta japonica]|uniref:Uncharacterized protein n=1 Tax=Eumeta variegata TaxID=151549 RepID=A0A4C1SRY7_EUMVA|nr:hypothetical protein EVAR_2515_1 [Eumeta japonica]